MTAVVFAALSALIWGSADYCGGRATRRVAALEVTVGAEIVGLPILVACLPFFPGTWHASDLVWGGLAGAAGLFGIVLLYHGLSQGAMAVVAPITAVTGAVIPVGVGLLSDEAPTAVALAGAACAVVAIGLVSLAPGGPGRVGAGTVGLALGAGTMFGVFFSLLAQAKDDAGLWPLVSMRVVAIALGAVLLLRRRLSLRSTRQVGGWVFAAGVGDIAASGLYLLATAGGLLSVVAPVAALYPASTVLLALAIDGERVRAIQVAGLGLAATALVLTAV